ncbi:ribulokinase [Lentibacillus jeotgali]|uniref:ribulokinase n=1 Tax=Lentibacillus jeotgali TaxID=558169 RepID=UPI0002627894|nr:ribulokinase [Lentibacillus jeotgali]
MPYSIGIDYGTESGRVLIINNNNGTIQGSSVIPYSHGVITEALPTKDKVILQPDYALQHPGDYLEVLYKGIPQAMGKANISKSELSGIGVDFTSSTMVTTNAELEPLCFQSEYVNRPHAWVKLWKHHGPTKEAKELLDRALQEKHDWLRRYGFNISPEWLIPKCLETIYEDERLYDEADLFLEAGDWIVSWLTNEIVRSNCSLGFKAFWNETDGFPEDFLTNIHPKLGEMLHSKLRGRIGKIGECAGGLSLKIAEELGLPQGLPVGVAMIDAHSAILGIGASQSNQLSMVMGTSTCHMMLNDKEMQVPGISGVVKDGIIPGLYAYEAGQTAVGDLFGWYTQQVPQTFIGEAKQMQMSVFELLEKRASKKSPGDSGLIALDWHNGNRSVLSNADLTGLLVGLTFQTKPEDIYRAYLEATAFGAKIIVDNYQKWGLPIDEIFACGGLPQKNELLMQIYADVLNTDIHVSSTDYAPAVGAAILGAVAAGHSGGGYDRIVDAVYNMKQPFLKTYHSIEENVQKYEKLYSMYKELHDHFGYKHNNFMKNLKIPSMS